MKAPKFITIEITPSLPLELVQFVCERAEKEGITPDEFVERAIRREIKSRQKQKAR